MPLPDSDTDQNNWSGLRKRERINTWKSNKLQNGQPSLQRAQGGYARFTGVEKCGNEEACLAFPHTF